MICLDEFGPLSIQPFSGKGWFEKGKPDRLPVTYHRTHGTRHLFSALDLKFDKLYGHVSQTKKHQDLLRFLKVLRRRYHRSEKLYIVLDNFSPHKHKTVRDWSAENNVELVFTPTNASWLNRIECHFGPLRKFALTGSNYENHKGHKLFGCIFAGVIRTNGIHKFYKNKRRLRLPEGALDTYDVELNCL